MRGCVFETVCILLLLRLVWAPALVARQTQQPGQLTGRVIDMKTNKPLFGANVIVKNTVLGSSSDADGHFRIPLPAGQYRIEAIIF